MWQRVVVLAMFAGCTSEAVPGDDSVIRCSTAEQCPADWVCLEDSTCSPVAVEEVVAETAPVLTIENFPDERQFRAVPFELALIDLNASSSNPESVSLELEYAFGEQSFAGAETQWWPGTLEYPQPWLLTDPENLAVEQVTWNAILDTDTDEAPEFRSSEVDSRGDGEFERVVSFVPSMRLRIRAVDDEGNRGPWINTPSFSLGNEVPQVENIFVPENMTQGLVPIEFELSDSSSDLAELFVQFRPSSATGWQDADIYLGQTLDVVTSPSPQKRVLVWNSDAPLGMGGIGEAFVQNIEIRIRAKDSPKAAVAHHGAWIPIAASLSLDNRPLD